MTTGRLTGVCSRRSRRDSTTRAAASSCRPASRTCTIECDDVLVAVGQENAFPWIERDLGLEFDNWGMPMVDRDDHAVDAPEGLLRRRRGVRPEEHHLGRRARPRGGDLDRHASAAARTSRERPPPHREPRQPEDGHPRVELRQRRSRSTAATRCRCATRRSRSRTSRSRSSSASTAQLGYAEAQRCLNCDVQTVFTRDLCIECDACVDICPMDCITFTANGDGGRSCARGCSAPALNLTQDLYVSDALKTGRVMVKDEDVCLHCGLCAERCPTGAWDMQKFLLDMTHASGRATACRSAPRPRRNDFVVKFANVNGSGSASANRLFARSILRMGVPVASRNIFPSNIQGLPTWYEVRVSRGRLSRPARRRRPDGRDEPADLGQGRRRDRARRLPVLRLDQAAAAVEVPRRHQRRRHAADRDLQRRATPTRASASCSRTSSMSARSPPCSASRSPEVEKLIGEQFKGKDKLIAPNSKRCTWAATTPDEHLDGRDRPQGAPRGRGRRPHLHRRQRRRRRSAASTAARRSAPGIRSRPRPRWPRRSRSTAASYRVDPATGKNRYAIVQAEDELASIGMVIGAAWNGARAFTATSGPGISLMQEFIGLAYFAEIPAVIFDVQRGGPSTGMPTRTQQSRHPQLRLRLARRHQARAAVPRGPARVLRVRRRRLRPRRPAADAGLRHARPRHRHERVAVRAARLGRLRAASTAAR